MFCFFRYFFHRFSMVNDSSMEQQYFPRHRLLSWDEPTLFHSVLYKEEQSKNVPRFCGFVCIMLDSSWYLFMLIKVWGCEFNFCSINGFRGWVWYETFKFHNWNSNLRGLYPQYKTMTFKDFSKKKKNHLLLWDLLIRTYSCVPIVQLIIRKLTVTDNKLMIFCKGKIQSETQGGWVQRDIIIFRVLSAKDLKTMNYSSSTCPLPLIIILNSNKTRNVKMFERYDHFFKAAFNLATTRPMKQMPRDVIKYSTHSLPVSRIRTRGGHEKPN